MYAQISPTVVNRRLIAKVLCTRSVPGEHPKCVNLFFCSDGSLARFLDIREQDAPTTNFIFAKLGCSRIPVLLTEKGRGLVFPISDKVNQRKFSIFYFLHSPLKMYFRYEALIFNPRRHEHFNDLCVHRSPSRVRAFWLSSVLFLST